MRTERPWTLERASEALSRWLAACVSIAGCTVHSTSADASYLRVRVFGKLDDAHRIALTVKLGRPLLKGEVCRHTCDVRACLRLEHLIVGTRLDNINDMMQRGRSIRGEKCPAALLTESQVRSMRAAHRDLGMRPIDLGVMFGVSRRCASDIVHANRWKHVA